MHLTFNYKEFKRRFREAAKARGIDPIEGSNKEQEAAMRTELAIRRYTARKSSFQIALENAELRRDTHYSRDRALVRAAAARQMEQAKRGVFWDEGRGFLRDDPGRTLDEELLAKAESANWWQLMHPDDWKPGAGSSSVERQATGATRDDVEIAHPPAPRKTFTLEEMGEVLSEVIHEPRQPSRDDDLTAHIAAIIASYAHFIGGDNV